MVKSQANVFDVAKYILRKLGPMSTAKLQKLVYYSQAWSLVWDGRPLFPERIEAWAYGPVVPKMFRKHQGTFKISSESSGRIARLDKDARDTVDAVLDYYGDKSPGWLASLTHHEDPWVDARWGLFSGERGNRRISYASMADYYGSLHGQTLT